MANEHVRIRSAIRAALGACALGLLSLSATAQTTAAGAADFNGARGTSVGNQTTFTIGGRTGTLYPTMGTSGLPPGSGWTPAGNFGVAKGTAAEGIKIGGATSMPLGQSRSLPLVVASRITPANLVKGFRAIAGPGLLFNGLPMLLQWMADSGVSPNPDATGAANQFLFRNPTLCYTAPCYQYKPDPAPEIESSWYADPGEACRARLTATNGGTFVSATTSTCYFLIPGGWNGAMTMNRRTVSPASGAGLPKSMDDIAPYMQAKQPEAGVVAEMLSRGVTLDVNAPTVTGPSSVAGPTTTSTDSAGKVTTTSITYKPTYNDNRVTNNIETTTTTFNPSTGETVTEQTKVEEAPEPEKTEDQCETNPDRLACAELDSPEAEIPREEVSVNYEAQNLFGDGSCPSDVTASIGTLGTSMKVWDWQKTCSMALPLRAIVIALATFAAALIVFPSKVEV